MGMRAFPFGLDGPGLQICQFARSVIATCVGAFVLLAMVGSLLTLGSASFGLLSQFSWVLFTLYGLAAYAGYWTCQHQVAWLVFWCLPMLHGLLWLQLVLIGRYGVWPGALWAQFGEHSADRLLMAQLGSIGLLGLPLAALLSYMWLERNYLLLVFHDFSAQLRPEHVKWNLLWHLASPAVPLAFWSTFLNPLVFTDLPRWPGTPPVVLVCLCANGPLLWYAKLRTAEWIGSVRWLARLSLVWCRPVFGFKMG